MKLEKNKNKVKSMLYLLIGVMISSFAFSFFLNPNDIVIGGVSGVGVIVKEFGIEPSLMMLLINIGLLLLSLVLVGKEFFLKTASGAIAFPLFAWFFDWIYDTLCKNKEFYDIAGETSQGHHILIIVFASIIMGYGLGIAVKHGGSTGGTEIPQKILYDKFRIPYNLSLYLVDGTVILVGFFILDQHVSDLLYEIIFVFLCGIIMDTTIFGGFNKRAVHIISDKCDEIKEKLIKDFGRGVTGIKVIGEYSQKDKKMIICVLSTLEYCRLREIIEETDSRAFFYCVKANEVRGEGFTYE